METELSLKERIIERLSNVFDPEISVNVWDLGLIYDINIKDNEARIRMTLTAPGCPIADEIIKDVENEVESLPEISKVTVELTWDPPWNQEMMSEEAKLELGF